MRKYLFFVFAAFIIGLLIALGILFFRSDRSVMNDQKMESAKSSSGGPYTWQQSCDSRCASIIGAAVMAEIDASDCPTLKVSKTLMQNAQEYNLLGGSGATGNWHTVERLQALSDRIASLHCQ